MRRPRAISVVAAFLFLATLVAGVVGAALLLPGMPLDKIWTLNERAHAAFGAFPRTSGVLLLTLGFITAAAALGLLHGRRWAWWLAVSIFACNGAGDLVSVFVTHDLVRSGIGVSVAAIFILCLLRGRSSGDFFKDRI